MSKKKTNKVVAVVCGDIHLSANAPVARSGEADWYAAMKRPLDQLAELSREHGCPILCAGDVFDHWKSPPELINFALRHLPTIYAVPGQHDLPNHSLDHIHRSAYQTLVEAGKIIPVPPEGLRIENVAVYGFPWGVPVGPPRPSNLDRRHGFAQIALVHAYVWIDGKGYKDAPEDAQVAARWKKQARQAETWFDVMVCGDNHQPFEAELKAATLTGGPCAVWNCGGFMRRRTDDASRKPRVGLVREDGTVEPHYLDISGEVLTEISSGKAEELPTAVVEGLADLTHRLQTLQATDLDFPEEMRRALDTVDAPPEVRELVTRALSHKPK